MGLFPNSNLVTGFRSPEYAVRRLFLHVAPVLTALMLTWSGPAISAPADDGRTPDHPANYATDTVDRSLAQRYEARLAARSGDLGGIVVLARTYERLGEYEKAESRYREALALSPDNVTLHVRIATVYRWMGMREAALHHYEEALAHDPGHTEALLGRAYLSRPENAPPGQTVEQAVIVRHRVLLGETLGEIAAQYLGNADQWREVYKANPTLDSPHVIRVGQVLNVPVAGLSRPLALIDRRQTAKYVVRKGDTLGTIARQQLGDAGAWRRLWRANPELADPDLIRVGQVLRLPNVSRTATADADGIRHTVAPGDTLRSIAARYLGDADRWKTVWKANRGITNPLSLEPGTVLLVPTGKAPDSLARADTALHLRHTVRSGDTLRTVAVTYLGDADRWKEIWKANPGVTNPLTLTPGSVIRIPGGDTADPLAVTDYRQPAEEAPVVLLHTVRPDETLSVIARRHLGSQDAWRDIWSMNRSLGDPDRIYPGQVIRLPVPERTALAVAPPL